MAEDIELLKLRAMAKSKAAQAADSEQANAPEPSFKSKAADVALTGLQAVGVPGGAVRSGIASIVGLSRPEDTLMNAPTTSEYMDRAGVPEGAKVSDYVGGYAEPGKGRFLRPEKGGMLDPSVRGVAGFAGDVALDPLTYLSGGLSAAAKTGNASKLLQLLKLQEQSGALSGVGKAANVALNPTELYAKGSAVRNYAKAFNPVDKMFPDKPQSTAEVLRKAGFVGNANEAAAKLAEINAEQGRGIGSTLKQAAQEGATTDVPESLKSAWFAAEDFKSHGSPEASKIGADIQSRIEMLHAAHPEGIPVDLANEVKSTMNNAINFQTLPETQRAVRSVAGGLAGGIKEAVGETNPELKALLEKQNAMYSSTSPKVQEKMTNFGNQVKQQKGPLGISAVDMMLGGAGAAGALTSHPEALGALVLKKAGEVATSVPGRTTRGYAAQKYFDSALPKDEILRQLLLRAQPQENNQ
jgi:hypothetical protein